jgi:uroporphyrinogen decarboxylase
LKNDLLLRALLRQPVERTPVWLMRQAGRYLPEYRATRARAGSFLQLCMTPELACEVTLQPLARYPLDAAILFSDILTIPHALGLGLQFETGEGPRIERPVRSRSDVARLGVPDPNTELRYVMDAVRLIRRELNGRVPLIGFAGSPWTVGTYIVEGGSSREFSNIKAMMYNEPATLHALLTLLIDSTTSYLNAQIAAGAQAVMVFDTWGGVLTPQQYRSSCSPKVAVRGSKRWQAPAATRWASTGRPIWQTRAARSRIASRCRAISIRTAYMRPRKRFARRSHACLRATVAATATSSTSATEFIRRSIRSMPAR